MMIKEHMKNLLISFNTINIVNLNKSFLERLEYTKNNCPSFNELYFGKITIEKILPLFDIRNPDKKIATFLYKLGGNLEKENFSKVLQEGIHTLKKLHKNIIGKEELISLLEKFKKVNDQKIILQNLVQCLEELTRIPGYLNKILEYNCNGPLRDIMKKDFSKLSLVTKETLFPSPPKPSQKTVFYSDFLILCSRVLKTTEHLMKKWFQNDSKISLYHNFRDPVCNLKTITEFRHMFSLLNQELHEPYNILLQLKKFS